MFFLLLLLFQVSFTKHISAFFECTRGVLVAVPAERGDIFWAINLNFWSIYTGLGHGLYCYYYRGWKAVEPSHRKCLCRYVYARGNEITCLAVPLACQHYHSHGCALSDTRLWLHRFMLKLLNRLLFSWQNVLFFRYCLHCNTSGVFRFFCFFVLFLFCFVIGPHHITSIQ